VHYVIAFGGSDGGEELDGKCLSPVTKEGKVTSPSCVQQEVVFEKMCEGILAANDFILPTASSFPIFTGYFMTELFRRVLMKATRRARKQREDVSLPHGHKHGAHILSGRDT
jgi:hypothetical protein